MLSAIQSTIDRPGQWIDEAPEGSTDRKIRIAVVGGGLILAGALFITIALATMKVIGPHGFNASNLSLGMQTLPFAALGIGLAGAGIGLLVSKGISRLSPNNQETARSIAKFIAFFAAWTASALLLGYVFSGGFINAFTQGLKTTQTLMALALGLATVVVTASALQDWLEKKGHSTVICHGGVGDRPPRFHHAT